MELDLQPFSTDTVAALNRFIQTSHNQVESFSTVKVSIRTQKNFDTFLGGGLAKKLSFVEWKETSQAWSCLRFVWVHSLMAYTGTIENNLIGKMKATILGRSRFKWKIKTANIRKTWKHMKFQTFSNIRLGPFLGKFFFTVSTLPKRTWAKQNYLLYLSLPVDLFCCLQKSPTLNFNEKHASRMLLQEK